MITNPPRWVLKVTHIPSGIVVTRDSNHFRNHHLALESAKRYLRSALAFSEVLAEDIVFEYNLPDEDTCPRELVDYRQKMSELAKISQELDLMGD